MHAENVSQWNTQQRRSHRHTENLSQGHTQWLHHRETSAPCCVAHGHHITDMHMPSATQRYTVLNTGTYACWATYRIHTTGTHTTGTHITETGKIRFIGDIQNAHHRETHKSRHRHIQSSYNRETSLSRHRDIQNVYHRNTRRSHLQQNGTQGATVKCASAGAASFCPQAPRQFCGVVLCTCICVYIHALVSFVGVCVHVCMYVCVYMHAIVSFVHVCMYKCVYGGMYVFTCDT